MTWDARRADRRRTALDETHICRVDQLLINRADDIKSLRAEVAGLEHDLAQARATITRYRIGRGVVACVGALIVLARCVWP